MNSLFTRNKFLLMILLLFFFISFSFAQPKKRWLKSFIDSNLVLPYLNNYIDLKQGRIFIDGNIWYGDQLHGNGFSMGLYGSYQAGSDLAKIVLSKLEIDQEQKNKDLDSKEYQYKIIAVRYSDINDCWYFQFRKKITNSMGDSYYRAAIICKAYEEGFYLFSFENEEKAFLAGERIMLRLLDSVSSLGSLYQTQWQYFFPFLSSSLKDMPRSNSYWSMLAQDSTVGSHSIFYSISDSDNTVYLLGSIHAGEADMYPLPAEIENSFDSSKHMVIEAIPEGNTVWELRNFSTSLEKYQTGESLLDLISNKEFEQIHQFIAKNVFYIKREQLQFQKPWVLFTFTSSMMMREAGLKPWYGVENHFMRIKPLQMSLGGLEEVKYHLSVLDRIDTAYWISELLAFNQKKAAAESASMVEHWKQADIRYFDHDIEQSRLSDESNYYDCMLKQRNEVMVDSIMQYLDDDEDYFVIAGSAHFAGRDSIIRLLKKRGEKVIAHFPQPLSTK